jgi:aryl-alcohol dehydrogenase
VIALGSNVSGLAKGDHVVASFCSCGGCAACKREEPGRCDLFMPLSGYENC